MKLSLQAKLFLIWYRLRYPIRVFIAIQLVAIGYFAWKNFTKLPTNLTQEQAIAMMWKVKSINDGDTFTVVRGNEEMKVKLCGVNAPDLNQPLGIKARDYLRSLLSHEQGRVNLIEVEKKDGVTLAEVFASTGRIDEETHVNTEMVKTGHASLDRSSSQTCRYTEELGWAEKAAKENKVGVRMGKI